MRKPKIVSAEEKQLDSVLQGSLEELPPEDIVPEVTPWMKAMGRILTGLALNAVTLNFLGLNYLLPAIGMMLGLLGFRGLRKENSWFRACWGLMVFRSLCFFPYLILNATIWGSAIGGMRGSHIVKILNIAAMLCLLFCLWQGIRAVQKKAGVPPRAGSAAALMVWYAVLLLGAFWNVSGNLVGILFLISFVFILVNLWRLSKVLNEAGYAIESAPVRVSDRAVTVCLTAVILVGMGCGYLFFQKYPMHWQAVEASRNGEREEIQAQLLELGFPEKILQDMTDADILACKGVLRVYVDAPDDHPLNKGRETTEQRADGTYLTTAYDGRELRISGAAVELPGERERWKIIHYFEYTENPGFSGTESIQLWSASRHGGGWALEGEVSGQLLCDRAGQTCAAAYYALERQIDGAVFAVYSMPDGGEHHRGYLSYTIEEVEDGCIVDSWINCTHQTGLFQYPVKTAMDFRLSGSWGLGLMEPFMLAQDAIQFYPTEEKIRPLSE